MKVTLLPALKGNNSYETCIYNFELSQKKCANGLNLFYFNVQKVEFHDHLHVLSLRAGDCY